MQITLDANPGTHESFLGLVHAADRDVVRQTRVSALETHEPYATNYRLERPNGDIRNVQERGEPVHDRRGQVVGLVGTLHDVTDRVEAETNIRHMTYHDALTGLPNRRSLRERLDADSSRGRQEATLIHVELQSLTRVRETLGLDVADRIIALVGTELDGLAQQASPAGGAFRLEGDAFQVLVPGGASTETVGRLAADWLAQLRRPQKVLEQEVAVSVRAGIVFIPTDGRTASQLIQRAQLAASHTVTGGAGFFDAGSESESAERMSLEGELRHAIDRRELFLEYQPIVDLKSGRIHTVEALIRWDSPAFGRVPSGRFVPVAEEIGLIGAMWRFVLQRSCQDATEWHRNAPYPIKVAINLSGTQFERDNDILEFTDRTLEQFGLSAEHLEYELTEGVLIEASTHITPTLEALRQRGISLSLDDFGTGYSSLAYLTRFPVDTLKIDRSFVTELPDSRRSANLVSAIMAMAHGLSLKVITEGVENVEQLEFIRQIDCDYVQGYFLSKPVRADTIQAMVDSGGVLLPPASLRAAS